MLIKLDFAGTVRRLDVTGPNVAEQVLKHARAWYNLARCDLAFHDGVEFITVGTDEEFSAALDFFDDIVPRFTLLVPEAVEEKRDSELKLEVESEAEAEVDFSHVKGEDDTAFRARIASAALERTLRTPLPLLRAIREFNAFNKKANLARLTFPLAYLQLKSDLLLADHGNLFVTILSKQLKVLTTALPVEYDLSTYTNLVRSGNSVIFVAARVKSAYKRPTVAVGLDSTIGEWRGLSGEVTAVCSIEGRWLAAVHNSTCSNDGKRIAMELHLHNSVRFHDSHSRTFGRFFAKAAYDSCRDWLAFDQAKQQVVYASFDSEHNMAEVRRYKIQKLDEGNQYLELSTVHEDHMPFAPRGFGLLDGGQEAWIVEKDGLSGLAFDLGTPMPTVLCKDTFQVVHQAGNFFRVWTKADQCVIEPFDATLRKFANPISLKTV